QSFFIPPARAPEEGFLRVEGLTTRAWPREAISFNAAAGEILGFAGLVGAGRSELAAALFGVEPPLRGEVILKGERLRIKNARDAMAHGIYLIPEDRRQSGLVGAM